MNQSNLCFRSSSQRMEIIYIVEVGRYNTFIVPSFWLASFIIMFFLWFVWLLEVHKQVLCYKCQYILWLHAQIFFLGNIEVFTHMISNLAFTFILSILNVDWHWLTQFSLKDPYILCWDIRKSVDVVYK